MRAAESRAGLGSATIADRSHSPTIDVVRGRLDDATSDELLAFWAADGALGESEARARLPEVVCVLRGPDGAIAGACSVFAADVALIGGRRFWIYRSLLPGEARDQAFAMIDAAFATLDAEFDGAAGAPIGLCAFLDERERKLRPEAEWPDPRMIYTGYLPDGRQVRIAYFEGAKIVG
ncbi:MAG: hypothetical protein QOH62_3940 [Solirubrobacteraceae bacterium]|nr:hypothetical protein [Solirubrobacteraceae bacterium]